MPKPKVTTRRAVAGRCPECGRRTIRGELEDGTLVEVDAWLIGPAVELRAFTAGVPTYRASWRGAIQLDLRTRRQIKVSPAGYSGSRIYLEHRCEGHVL